MKYSFPQFRTEIVDPTWEINYSSVNVNHITKTVTFDAVATTPDGSRFGVTFENVPTGKTSWDEVKLDELLAVELQQYELR
jgi:hypothetical protein